MFDSMIVIINIINNKCLRSSMNHATTGNMYVCRKEIHVRSGDACKIFFHTYQIQFSLPFRLPKCLTWFEIAIETILMSAAG